MIKYKELKPMKNKCKQCGYDWESRKENPTACPKCKRYDWNEAKK